MEVDNNKSTQLFVVATPIGNLADITYRAVETLRSADIIYCEDTRHTRRLLDHYDIRTKCVAVHQHTSDDVVSTLLQQLADTGSIAALVTDAGTPTISDPGWAVVRKARDMGIVVQAVPGADAVTAALSISGLPVSSYTFFGFIPHKKGRETFFTTVLDHQYLAVFYESPHRILKTLGRLTELAPDRRVLVARELTKIHEEVVDGTAAQLYDDFSSRTSIKGEFVVLVPPVS